jgi:hypothetical protein
MTNEPPRGYMPNPPRVEVTVLTLAEADRRQRAYADRRRLWTDPWHGVTGRTWPARRTAGPQVHDPRQKRLL